MSKQDIIQRVNRYLGPHQTAEMTIATRVASESNNFKTALDDAWTFGNLLHADGEWWYVPVRPTTDKPITYSYFGVLTDIEGE